MHKTHITELFTCTAHWQGRKDVSFLSCVPAISISIRPLVRSAPVVHSCPSPVPYVTAFANIKIQKTSNQVFLAASTYHVYSSSLSPSGHTICVYFCRDFLVLLLPRLAAETDCPGFPTAVLIRSDSLKHHRKQTRSDPVQPNIIYIHDRTNYTTSVLHRLCLRVPYLSLNILQQQQQQQ